MKHNDGFTLIELMILVAIIGILAGLAIPQIYKMKGRLVLGAETRDLVNHLQKAKIYAIRTGGISDITISTNKYSMITIYTDKNGDIQETGKIDIELKNGVTLTHNLTGTGPTTQINSMGVFDDNTLPANNPQIKVSSSFGDRIITISYGGMISTL